MERKTLSGLDVDSRLNIKAEVYAFYLLIYLPYNNCYFISDMVLRDQHLSPVSPYKH